MGAQGRIPPSSQGGSWHGASRARRPHPGSVLGKFWTHGADSPAEGMGTDQAAARLSPVNHLFPSRGEGAVPGGRSGGCGAQRRKEPCPLAPSQEVQPRDCGGAATWGQVGVASAAAMCGGHGGSVRCWGCRRAPRSRATVGVGCVVQGCWPLGWEMGIFWEPPKWSGPSCRSSPGEKGVVGVSFGPPRVQPWLRRPASSVTWIIRARGSRFSHLCSGTTSQLPCRGRVAGTR